MPAMNNPTAIALLGLLTAVVVTPATARQPRADYREGEVLVRYRDDVAGPALRSELGVGVQRRLHQGRIELLRLPSMTTVAQAIELLQRDPRVAYAEPNFLRRKSAYVPNDPLFDRQWGLRNTGQANFVTGGQAGVPGADLNMTQAWDADGDGRPDRTGQRSVVVAVVDDGVETTHDDLAANIVAGYDAADDDNDPNPSSADDFHGTAVAGCIGAVGDNNIGVAGAAWNVGIMPLRFDYDVVTHVAALEYARDNGASIVNASFGGPGFSRTELEAIRDLGARDILYVASAGNDDSNIDRGQLNYPAHYDADNIVSVASISRQGQITSFSQYGPLSADVAAPGLQIVTTFVGNDYTLNGISGTSFSAPYVAGIAALIRSQYPQATVGEVKARLIESGVNGSNAKRLTVGGRVDADAALDLAPRPSLVIESVVVDAAGNGVLDPGETTTLRLTIRNLWQPARNVRISGSADNGVEVGGGATPALVATLDRGGRTTVDLPVTVPPGLSGHRYVQFRFTLTADGGYSTTRDYQDEIAAIPLGADIQAGFASPSSNLYDEFQAWHVDVARSGPRFLVVETDSTDDVDLLVKRDVPPQYEITVGIDPEDDEAQGFFCTSGTAANCEDPDTLIGGETASGIERVCFSNPQVGTYHIVAVNFAQLQQALPYRISVYGSNVCGPEGRVTTDTGNDGGGGGGGSWNVMVSLGLALMAALRRRARWTLAAARQDGRSDGRIGRLFPLAKNPAK